MDIVLKWLLKTYCHAYRRAHFSKVSQETSPCSAWEHRGLQLVDLKRIIECLVLKWMYILYTCPEGLEKLINVVVERLHKT